jgi:nucleotide-binding universal stress UspA family protein
MALNKILVAHDFSEPANRALALAADLAQAVNAKLELVHVHPDVYDGHSTPAVGLPWPSSGQEERYMRFLDTELVRVITSVVGPDAVTTIGRHVVRGEPVRRLEAMAVDLGADVICIGSTGKGAVERMLLGSVSTVLVRRSPIPVLTVH